MSGILLYARERLFLCAQVDCISVDMFKGGKHVVREDDIIEDGDATNDGPPEINNLVERADAHQVSYLGGRSSTSIFTPRISLQKYALRDIAHSSFNNLVAHASNGRPPGKEGKSPRFTRTMTDSEILTESPLIDTARDIIKIE